jgi:alkylation response protein AidB-like acyl-CoA dehydrogenase
MHMSATVVPPYTSYLPLAPTGLEQPLTPTQREIYEVVHKFAAEVMRPLGQKLDRMSAAEVIAPESPFWEVHRQYNATGLFPSAIFQLPPEEIPVVIPMVFEELGWGDAGLAIFLTASMLPSYMALLWNRPDLVERFPETDIGCRGITEPDHGSDTVDYDKRAIQAGGRWSRSNCIAKLDGDVVRLNGQKSAWVSNGGVAKHCILYSGFDRGGAENEFCVVYVPLDLPGVSRGKPLEKIGQRAYNQAELVFEDVAVPRELLVVEPEQYKGAAYSIFAAAGAAMGAIFTGCARSAYELALDYAHARKQGGATILQHQSVKSRLFHMFRKVEAARALNRRVYTFNLTNPIPAGQGSIATKITSTQTAFEVASDAIQIFGGNGLTHEYPIEKIFRDARSSMIEDGCNEVLSIRGGSMLVDPERL